jgi:ADP-ribosylglycohydrolase
MTTGTERYRGCLLGLAAGDALGTTLEFHTPGSFTQLTDRVGGEPFHLRAKLARGELIVTYADKLLRLAEEI